LIAEQMPALVYLNRRSSYYWDGRSDHRVDRARDRPSQ